VFDLIPAVLELAGMADNPHPAEAKLAQLLGLWDPVLPQYESQRGKLDTEPLVLAAMADREYCLR
jgi:hypothetical protein